MSSFAGLNTATTALWTQRRGLDVTGQNIANVNTEGYSRQRTDLRALGGTTVPAFHSGSRGVGAGVSADQVIRIRDAFLEGRAHTEHSAAARLAVESQALGQIEQAFREPGDTGIQSLLAETWAAFGDLANDPQDGPARSQLLQRLETLTSGMRAARSTLDAQWTQTHDSLSALVTEVNSTAEGIATLNRAIQRATQAGAPVNELADERDVLVLRLAEQVGATVRPGEDGALDVTVGGVGLVSGSTATRLAVAGPTGPDGVTPGDRPRLVSSPGGAAVVPGGTAAGQLAVMGELVPAARAALDGVAATLVAQVNAVHRTGYDLDGTTGRDLLGPVSGPVTAASIAVLVTDPRQVAAAELPPDASGPSTDGGVAAVLARSGTRPDGVDATYRGMIVELGVRAAVSERNLGIQSVISASVDASRESVAGVNLDEEMTNMLHFQHAYTAAARLITAIDEALEVLITRTGAVGR